MSDMSGPRSLPPDAGHDQHDTLLVAQLAMADPLPEEQHRAAASLVASCPACSALAADLRTIQRAVAREPAPPRRRDHRISTAQAEQLRGSALRRFLRRLALPETGALRPLAAGVLSVGLLFVVAGTVWPEELGPGTGGSPTAAPLELQAVPGSDADGVAAPDASVVPAPMSALEADAETAPGSGASAAEDLQLESAPGEAAPMSEELRDGGRMADDVARSGLSREDETATSSAKAADPGLADEAEAAAEAVEPPSTGSLPRESLRSTAAGADSAARDEVGTTSTDAVEATSLEPGRPFETALIVIGSLLALGGLALLALVWVARRLTRDPLLR